MVGRCVEEPPDRFAVVDRPDDGRRSHQHLVDHARQAVDIGALVQLGDPHRLLRAHVARRADRHPGARQRLPIEGADRPGDTEVGHDGVPVRQQDVLRLDVTMHDTLSMRVIEGRRDLPRDAHGRAQLHRRLG